MRVKYRKTAIDFLGQAAAVLQERGEQRDLPSGERNMERIVTVFNALTRRDLTELEGYFFMLSLKLARASADAFNPDDLLDTIGYSALALEHQARLQASTQPTDI